MSGRSERVDVRCAPEEKARWISVAGPRRLSEWARETLNAAVPPEGESVPASHVPGQMDVEEVIAEIEGAMLDTPAAGAMPFGQQHPPLAILDETHVMKHETVAAVRPHPNVHVISTAGQPADPGMTFIPAKPPPAFALDCSNGTYHWKHGPGNPCRRCGGEA